MISKGSWVALATCSAESHIANKLKWFSQATQVVQSASSDVSVS